MIIPKAKYTCNYMYICMLCLKLKTHHKLKFLLTLHCAKFTESIADPVAGEKIE